MAVLTASRGENGVLGAVAGWKTLRWTRPSVAAPSFSTWSTTFTSCSVTAFAMAAACVGDSSVALIEMSTVSRFDSAVTTRPRPPPPGNPSCFAACPSTWGVTASSSYDLTRAAEKVLP